jgi:heme exporter protein A
MHGRTRRYRDPGRSRTVLLMGRFSAMRLTAANLACVRGGQVVFSGLTFAVEAGQMVAVTGTNGAGKTTLLRLLAGLLRLSDGALTLTGGEPDATLAEQAHYLGHQDALKLALTVGENLEFWARYLGGKDAGADGSLETNDLETWGLAALKTLPAAYLSAGQRRRLSLCRLTGIRRPVWLLDEPTAALDAAAQETLGRAMAAHLAQGGIIVAATHGPLPFEAAVELRLSSRHAEGRAA